MALKPPLVRNAILAGLSVEDNAALARSLEPMMLQERAILHKSGKAVDHVYFLETGAVSLRVVAGESVFETALVGYRGAVGSAALFGGCIPAHQSVVLFSGRATRIAIAELDRLMRERPQLYRRILRYVEAPALQEAQAGLCCAWHDLEERLACWLSLACDALEDNNLPVTHEYLSSVLGLRRAGVTEALSRFDAQDLIRKARGVLLVEDRLRLRMKACACYARVARAYDAICE
jgi:CRP-like cAMP-binding protein